MPTSAVLQQHNRVLENFLGWQKRQMATRNYYLQFITRQLPPVTDDTTLAGLNFGLKNRTSPRHHNSCLIIARFASIPPQNQHPVSQLLTNQAHALYLISITQCLLGKSQYKSRADRKSVAESSSKQRTTAIIAVVNGDESHAD